MVRQSLPVIKQFIAAMTKRGVRTILVEAPDNPEFNALKAEDHAAYLEAIKTLATRQGAAFWDLNEEVGIAHADFADAVHLGNDATRMRFQKVFLEHLSAALRDVAPSPSP
jgi:hypothetical protein